VGGLANKLHLPQLQKMEDVKVTWLAGYQRDSVVSLADLYSVQRWTLDYREVLADPTVDAVILTVPHPLRVTTALEALAAGKHVLVQTPLTTSMAEADALAAAAGTAGRTVMCLPHFGPEVHRARETVVKGEIGRPSGGHCRVSHGGPEVFYAGVRDVFGEVTTDQWYYDAGRSAVGALFDAGVYAVSALVSVLGSVVRVMGLTATLNKPTTLEDTASLLLQFENGALGTVETGWCDPARTWELSAHGTQGKLTIPGPRGERLAQWVPGSYTRDDAPPTVTAVDLTQIVVGDAHTAFVRCIREGVQPTLANAQTARHVTEILLAATGSAQLGQAVEIVSRLA
jgi:predicted dehydrogenase